MVLLFCLVLKKIDFGGIRKLILNVTLLLTRYIPIHTSSFLGPLFLLNNHLLKTLFILLLNLANPKLSTHLSAVNCRGWDCDRVFFSSTVVAFAAPTKPYIIATDAAHCDNDRPGGIGALLSSDLKFLGIPQTQKERIEKIRFNNQTIQQMITCHSMVKIERLQLIVNLYIT